MNASQIQQILSTFEEADGKFKPYYIAHFYVMFIVSMVTVVILMFKPGRFKGTKPEFRPFLRHILVGSICFMIDLCVWQPVSLAPSTGGYSVGILGYLFGTEGYFLGMSIGWTCRAQVSTTLAIAFLLQSYQLKVVFFNICQYLQYLQCLRCHLDLRWQYCLL